MTAITWMCTSAACCIGIYTKHDHTVDGRKHNTGSFPWIPVLQSWSQYISSCRLSLQCPCPCNVCLAYSFPTLSNLRTFSRLGIAGMLHLETASCIFPGHVLWFSGMSMKCACVARLCSKRSLTAVCIDRYMIHACLCLHALVSKRRKHIFACLWLK